MNKNGIQMQVVNNNLIDFTNATACQESNDLIYHQWVKPNPTRYSAWCALAMGNATAAAAELKRCVTQLGFVGGLTNSYLTSGNNVTYYDSKTFWPVFAMAEQLDVPIYIHPSFAPSPQVLNTGGEYAPGVNPDGSATFTDYIAANLASTSWQFETGAGIQFLRLYAAGLFNAYPNLKLIFGHMGELVPFMLERAEYFMDPLLPSNKKSLSQTWYDNCWVTTSGFFWLQQVSTVLATTQLSHIMYSVDYPFNTNEQGLAFMEELLFSGLVSVPEWLAIASGNAQALLNT